MLDDLKFIHEKDAQDALGIAEKQWQQYRHSFEFSASFSNIQDIIVAGMGGSGLAAKAFSSWPGVKLPYVIVQDYDLPIYANDKTLLICSSYSGNTEEVVAVLSQALSLNKKPQIVVVASGGKLIEIAKSNNLPTVQLPSGYQPRHTFGYQLRALVEIFESAKLTSGKIKELDSAGEWLQSSISGWLADVPTMKNYAKTLALELMGKSPVIYGGTLLFPAAYKWKISFNENSKNIAWCNVIPEFNHNEFLGWTSHPINKPYAVIDLRSNLEHTEIQKRFEVTAKLLSGKRPEPHIVQAEGKTLVQQLLWTVALGDFVSLYLALLNGLNPTPVDLIEKFKKELTS